MKSFVSIYHTLRFWIVIVLLSMVLGTCSILGRAVDWSGALSNRVARLWGRLICLLNGIRVEITGLEHVLKDEAQIFVANHQGYFDIFALLAYLPVQIRWVAKSSLFRIPFIGWAMKASDYISVDRENRKQAYRAFLATVEKIKSGYSVVIFPEGTRSEDGSIGPFKKGSHLLAQRSQAPMVPVTIIGTRDIIKKGTVVIRPGPVRIIIAPPVRLNPKSPEEGPEVLNSIRDTICKTFAENQKES